MLSVPLGGEVDDLAVGGDYLWAFARDSGVLVRVDQRTGQVRRFALTAWRGLPLVIAASARGVWLADQHSTRPDLIRVDPQTGRIVARPRLPGGPGPVTDLAAAHGWLWVLVPDAARPPGWRVLRVNTATNRVDGISGDTPGTQLTGHTAAIWASAGKLWVTGSMHVIVRLDPPTLAMGTTATGYESVGLVFGDGHAWALSFGRPRLAEIDARTGKAIRRLATPPPSATGDDYAIAGHDQLWVFRGTHLAELNPTSGHVITSARVYPLGASSYPPAVPAVITPTGLWYLAQTSHGIALDRIGARPQRRRHPHLPLPRRSPRARPLSSRSH